MMAYRTSLLNTKDKTTSYLLSLARTPLVFYPSYRYHRPLPSVIMIENTNRCNSPCAMCPRDTLTRTRGFMDFGLFEKIIHAGLDKMQIGFYGTDEDSYSATMRRLQFKAVWTTMVLRSWGILMCRPLWTCGMGPCCPRSEGTLENWSTVGFRPVRAAIGYIGVEPSGRCR